MQSQKQYDSLQDEMRYYLEKGVVQDVYFATQSYQLLKTVGRHGPKLGQSAYVDFFQSLQSILSDHLIIHITKLFEKPNPRYDSISIPFVLKFIDDHQGDLQIIETPIVCQNLEKLGISVMNEWSVSSLELTKVILRYFKNALPSIENSRALQSLKVLRDKRIAHREAVDISNASTTTFGEFLNLIRFAENFIVVVGAAYTSSLYGFVNDSFYFADDATTSSCSLEKIMTALARVGDSGWLNEDHE